MGTSGPQQLGGGAIVEKPWQWSRLERDIAGKLKTKPAFNRFLRTTPAGKGPPG